MKFAYKATIILDMHNPEEFGYQEPTMKGLIEMLKKGNFEVEIPELFDEPVYTFKQI